MAADPRPAGLLPRPLWAWLGWAGLSVIAVFVQWMFPLKPIVVAQPGPRVVEQARSSSPQGDVAAPAPPAPLAPPHDTATSFGGDDDFLND